LLSLVVLMTFVWYYLNTTVLRSPLVGRGHDPADQSESLIMFGSYAYVTYSAGKDDKMDLIWQDYDPETMGYIEKWLDDAAIKSTGLDEGFRAFYEYWANEDGFILGKNYWCKVVSEATEPFAVIALCEHEGKIIIMELFVAPEKRGLGLGTKLLKELLHGGSVLGFGVEKSEAVIFPDNTASQKAFEKAGFRHHHTHEDGDALYYVYEMAPENQECRLFSYILM